MCKMSSSSFLCPPHEDRTGSHWVGIKRITIKAFSLSESIQHVCEASTINSSVCLWERLHLNITVFTRKLHRKPLSLLLVLPRRPFCYLSWQPMREELGNIFSGVSTHAAISSPIWTEILLLCLCSSAWNLILSLLGSNWNNRNSPESSETSSKLTGLLPR